MTVHDIDLARKRRSSDGRLPDDPAVCPETLNIGIHHSGLAIRLGRRDEHGEVVVIQKIVVRLQACVICPRSGGRRESGRGISHPPESLRLDEQRHTAVEQKRSACRH
jgi:hypothetical protein